MGYQISAGRPDQRIISKKKRRTFEIVDFAVQSDLRIKLKESEKKDKYLNLASEWKKKLWKLKLTIIPIEIDALGTVNKRLVKELEDLEIRERQHYRDRPEYKEESWRLEQTYCPSNSSKKSSFSAGVKNSKRMK